MTAEPFIGRQPEDRGDEAAGAAPAPVSAGEPIGRMSFEEALAELEGIVQRLERGQLDLDASIAAYERGAELRRHCAEKLRHAQLRVEKLTLDRDGAAKLAAFDPK